MIMARAFVAIGSNIQAKTNILAALHLLRTRVHFLKVSNFYQTEAEGTRSYEPFVNGVISFETDLPPREVKYSLLRGIECALGRVRSSDKNAPRPIDLDLIIYGEEVIQSDELVLPDPEIYTRPFVAFPLLEIAPDLILPDSGKPLRNVALSFQDKDMHLLQSYTELLRRELLTPQRL